jgi:hypothetical protein
MNGKTRAQNKLEHLHENLVKPMRYLVIFKSLFVDRIDFGGKKISLIHNCTIFIAF